jgi:hypothetical protein
MRVRIADLDIGAGPGSRQQALSLAGIYLAEREKTKRLLVSAACLFLVTAGLLVVFAPEHRDELANVCGAVFVVMALGTIGVSKFKLKMPGIELDTREDSSEPGTGQPQNPAD